MLNLPATKADNLQVSGNVRVGQRFICYKVKNSQWIILQCEIILLGFVSKPQVLAYFTKSFIVHLFLYVVSYSLLETEAD